MYKRHAPKISCPWLLLMKVQLWLEAKKWADWTAIINELQNTLQAVDNWCEGNGLVIAKDKTALMPMFAKNKEEIINHPIVRGRKIKIVTLMKYLGVILDSNLDWYTHTLYLENKVLSIRNNLVRCWTGNWVLTFQSLLTMYRVKQKERTKLREGVPYVKLYWRNPKHLHPNLNGLGDNGNWKFKIVDILWVHER